MGAVTGRWAQVGRELRVGRSGRDLLPWLVAAAPVLVLLPAMAGGLLAPQDGWVQYFPIRTLAADALADGRFPAWTAVEFAGTGLFELGQAAVLSPLGLLGVVLPAVLSYHVTLAVGLSANALGTYLLARRVAGNRLGALVAAVGFGASSFMWGELTHPDVLVSVASLPWALLGVELAAEPGGRRRGIAVVAAAFALAVLGGHQQMAAAVAMGVGLWAVAGALLGGPGWRRVLDALAGLALGGLVAAVQVLPSLVAAGASGRAGYSFEEASSLALERRQLPLLLFPHASGSPEAGDLPVQMAVSWPQLGVVLVVLAVGALPAWRRDWRVRAAVVVTAVVGVAALSPAFRPLARLVYEVPTFGFFRVWTRYLVVPRLLVALLAAVAVATACRGTAGQRRLVLRWWAGAGAAYVLVAAGLAVVPVLTDRDLAGLAVPAVLAVATAAGAAALAGADRRRSARLAGVALVAVAAVEAVYFMAPRPWALPTVPAATVEEAFRPATAGRFVSDAPGGLDRYLQLGDYPDEEVDRVIPRAPLSGLSGALSANGYTPLAGQDYLDVVGMDFYGNVGDPACLLEGPSGDLVLDLLRVTSLVTQDRGTARDLRSTGDVRPVEGAPGFFRVDREPGLPDAWLVPARDAAALSPRRTDGLACRRVDPPADVAAARSVVHHPDGMTVRVDARGPSVLVASLADGPGWEATVDGRAAPTRTAYGALVAVEVPAGARTVELRYRTPLLLPGALLSLAGLVVLGGVAWTGRGRSGTVRGSG